MFLDANANGLTGDVVLRIELYADGKIRSIQVKKAFDPSVGRIATGMMRMHPKCRFKPAIGKDGKPAAYIIEEYRVSFERQ